MQVEIRIFVVVLQTRLRRLGKSWIEGTSISSVEKFQSPPRDECSLPMQSLDFHPGNLLCWAERPGSAKSRPLRKIRGSLQIAFLA